MLSKKQTTNYFNVPIEFADILKLPLSDCETNYSDPNCLNEGRPEQESGICSSKNQNGASKLHEEWALEPFLDTDLCIFRWYSVDANH